MKCISCSGEWTPPPSKSVTECPFCKANLIKDEASFNNAGEALQFIVDNYGVDALLTKNLFSDIAPTLIDERELIKIFRERGILDVFKGALGLPPSEQKNTLKRAMNKLPSYLKNSPDAISLMNDFVVALGWAVDPLLQQPVLDSPTVQSMPTPRHEVILHNNDDVTTIETAAKTAEQPNIESPIPPPVQSATSPLSPQTVNVNEDSQSNIPNLYVSRTKRIVNTQVQAAKKRRKLLFLMIASTALFIIIAAVIILSRQTASPLTPIIINEFEEYVRITFPNVIMFAAGGETLTQDGVERVNYLANIIAQFPNHRVAIQGHTDDIPMSPNAQFPSNLHLSAARAVSVAEHLISHHGFAPKLFEPIAIGEHRPIDTNSTAEGRAANRRVEVFILTPTHDEVEAYAHFTIQGAFDAGRGNLTQYGTERVDYLADIFAQFPNHRIVIHGHTDNIPMISNAQFPSNLHLSVARAVSVAEHLISHHGFAPELIEPVGIGEHRPIDTNSTVEGRANNRRVEIFVFSY